MAVKIRLWAILAISAVLFGVIGWFFVKPTEPAGAMTILLSDSPVKVIMVLALLTVVSAALATVIGGRYGELLGALAVPVGLSVWSIRSGTMERLLLEYVSPAERAGMFERLAVEVVFLFGAVVLGLASSRWLTRRLGFVNSSEDTMSADPTKVIHQTDSQAKTSKLPQWLNKDWVRGGGALVLSCIVAIIILKLFARSGQTWMEGSQRVWISTVPDSGQIIFAVAAAFFLATMLTYQIFTMNLWYFLPAPVLVALIAYISAVLPGSQESLAGVAAPVVVSSMVLSTILPVQYIGIGTLALAGGYWYGLNLQEYLSGREE